jgi:hypothetical protein
MKVALCFSGHMRDLNETKEFWTDLIKNYDMDVYASFWDTENEEFGDTINNFLTIYTPKKYEIENYKVFKETTQDLASLNVEPSRTLINFLQQASKAFGQLAMYYKVWKCNMLSKQLGIEYDLVIRARTDTRFDANLDITKNDMLNVPIGAMMVQSFKNSDGLNDCFAYGPPKIMNYYSFIFLQMMEYLKAGHYAFPPEHFLAVHFSKIKIDIRYIPTYMTITRVSRGTPNDLYNYFIENPVEYIVKSDWIDFTPDPNYNFKRDIKDDFIV